MKMRHIKKKKIYYKGDDEVGYLYLPNYYKGVKSHKTIILTDLIDYKGPSVYFDFNEKNEIIGIEIIV